MLVPRLCTFLRFSTTHGRLPVKASEIAFPRFMNIRAQDIPETHSHGPDNAEHELRKAYKEVVESNAAFFWDRENIPGVDPKEIELLYRRAFQAHRRGDRLAAELRPFHQAPGPSLQARGDARLSDAPGSGRAPLRWRHHRRIRLEGALGRDRGPVELGRRPYPPGTRGDA